MQTEDSARHCYLSQKKVFLVVDKDKYINFSRVFPY